MSEHPDVGRTREAYDAFDKGDLATLGGPWRADLLWHEPGSSPLAGDHRGPEAVLGMFTSVMEMTGNSLRAEALLMCADDAHGTALDTLCAHVIRFDADGQVTEFGNAPTEPVVWDAFWS